MNSKDIGNITETKALAEFTQHGISVSVPWGENNIYDLVIDINQKLYKVQCKTGRYRHGTIVANLSTNVYSKQYKKICRRNYDKSLLDFFVIYEPKLDKLYLVPVTLILTLGEIRLRYDPISQNMKGKTDKLLFAKDFEFNVILRQISELESRSGANGLPERVADSSSVSAA